MSWPECVRILYLIVLVGAQAASAQLAPSQLKALQQASPETLEEKARRAERAQNLARKFLATQGADLQSDQAPLADGTSTRAPAKLTVPKARPRSSSRAYVPGRRTAANRYHDLPIEPEQRRAELTAFVARHPQHRTARLELVRMLVLGDDLINAGLKLEPLLDHYLRDTHPDWQPWFWAGTLELMHGNVSAARAHLEVALTKTSSQASIWLQLAVLEQQAENCAGALQYLQIARRLDPALPGIALNEGYCLERLGEPHRALGAYQEHLANPAGEPRAGVRMQVVKHVAELATQATPRIARASEVNSAEF
ncbi:MAG: hypothetical protein AAF513_00350 [Pseudomonadota bacterium]